MAKHESVEVKLRDIINYLGSDSPWYEVVEVEIEGLQEALSKVEESEEDDAFAEANAIEAEYLKSHLDDVYLVSWPEHVTHASFNSDASYQLIG